MQPSFLEWNIIKNNREFWGSAERRVDDVRKEMVSELFSLPFISKAELFTFQHVNKEISTEIIDSYYLFIL